MCRAARATAFLALTLAVLLSPGSAGAAEATVAVASNFLVPLERLRGDFQAETGHRLRISPGSTGALHAQIVNGAPFDVFLAADRRRPRRLVDDGLAVPGSRFTYAIGALTLWSPDPERIDHGPDVLRLRRFRHLAIANPDLAPYGLAARQTLAALGLWETLLPKLVRGENVTQAFQFVVTGNAELGFVARAQVQSMPDGARGSRWDVPSALHTPICQDAVLLARARDNPAARALLEYLRSPRATRLRRELGYRSRGCGEPEP